MPTSQKDFYFEGPFYYFPHWLYRAGVIRLSELNYGVYWFIIWTPAELNAESPRSEAKHYYH